MAETIHQLFDEAVQHHGERVALRWRRDGTNCTTTWSEYRATTRRAARAFMALGVEPGAGVAIMGFNRPEWFYADLGAMQAGAVPTGIYTTTPRDQVRYIASHCEATVAVLENAQYLELFESLRAELPRLRTIVMMEGGAAGDDVLSWEEFLVRGDSVAESALDARITAQRADDLCTLIYTSGTTGNPKAVMLCHRNVTFLAGAAAPLLGLVASDRFVSYLPLSHIAEQCVSFFLPMVVGGCTTFAESLERLPETLREVRPTVFFGVPRVWEKMQARMQAVGASGPAWRRRLVAWARAQGLAAGYAAQRGGKAPAFHALAERLVLGKVRHAIGLDQARICLASAAPIALSTLEFFLSIGIPILEVYGMSEVTGPATVSSPGHLRTGRAGTAIPGTELRLASDGEVEMRGPHVFLGYYKDAAATRETLDEEGWVHSGDIGELDADGFLRITDRKKELLITSGGKNIAPAPIEARLKAIPGVAQAVLLGDKRNFVAALLTLDPERIAAVAAAAGSSARDVATAASDAAVRRHLEAAIAGVNRELARYESVRKFAILPGELTIDGGELTPTMKLKRRVIREKYAAEIAALYDDEALAD